MDSEINDQYRTIPGARRFLMNIVKFPGCGRFSAPGSVVVLDDATGRVCGVCLASLVSANSGARDAALRFAGDTWGQDRVRNVAPVLGSTDGVGLPVRKFNRHVFEY